MSKRLGVIISLLLAAVLCLQAALLVKVDRVNKNMYSSDSFASDRIDRIQSTLYELWNKLDKMTEQTEENEAAGTVPSYEPNGSHFIIRGYDADMLDWDPDHGSLYFADPAFWGEKFSGVGVEGSATWANAEKTELTMQFTVSNGKSVTGAMDGMRFSCRVDVGAGTLMSQLVSVPAAEGETMELTAQELVDIALTTAQVMRDAAANAH